MGFRAPSLRAIIAFEAAARHENFNRAAEELHLTQSAVSHAIRSLEDRIAHPLFLRVGRRVELTPRGQQLATQVRASLGLLSDAFDPPPTVDHERRVVIGAPPEFASRALLPKLCGDAVAGWCEVRTDVGADALRLQTVDILVAPAEQAWPAYDRRTLGPDVVAPVCVPQLAGEPGGLERLPRIENALYPWARWMRHLHRDPPSTPPAVVVHGWDLAVDAARSGAGVCLARLSFVERELHDGALVLMGPMVEAPAAYQLVWDAQRDGRVAAVVGWMLRTFAELPPQLGAFPSDAAGLRRVS